MRPALSRAFVASSGVPQGSHLRSLFNIVNDIVGVISNSNVLLFADDMKVFRRIGAPDDAVLFQADLNNIATWCVQNELYLIYI